MVVLTLPEFLSRPLCISVHELTGMNAAMKQAPHSLQGARVGEAGSKDHRDLLSPQLPALGPSIVSGHLTIPFDRKPLQVAL